MTDFLNLCLDQIQNQRSVIPIGKDLRWADQGERPGRLESLHTGKQKWGYRGGTRLTGAFVFRRP